LLISPRQRFANIRRFSSDTGAENDDQLLGPKGEVLQGKQVWLRSSDGNIYQGSYTTNIFLFQGVVVGAFPLLSLL
jgi:hypothetical protein